MDYLKPAAFRQLKAFFIALKEGRFKPNSPQDSTTVIVEGRPTPVSKSQSLDLLRSFPDLHEEKFKDDNFLLKYLSDPVKRDRIFSSLTKQQQIELIKTIEEKPLPAEATTQQAGSQTVSTGESASTMAGEATSSQPQIPSMPSFNPGTTSRNIPRPSIPEEGPATAKARRIQEAYEQANPATAKIDRLEEQTKAFKTTQSAPANPGTQFKSGLGSSFKTFGSNASISFRKYSGKIAGGLGQIAGGVGRNVLGPGLSSVYNQGARAVLGGGNTFSRLSGQARRRITSLKGTLPKPSGKLGGRFALGILLALFLFMFISGIIAGVTGTTGGTTPGTSPVVGATADISSCKFTRSGSSQVVKSSLLQGLISSAAVSAGIPAPVLASVAMHESPDFVTNADNSHDAIKSGQYCNYGQTICINKENTGTLYDGACLTDDTAKGAKTAQAIGLMQNIDIYNQGKGDLCSITNSLAIAAAKLKKDGVTAQPTQEQIKTGVTAYYNACDYDGGDYCKEVWQDLQNCQTVTTPGTIPVLPPGADYIAEISKNFHVNFVPGKFTQNHLRWSWEILSQAKTIAPNIFRNLIDTVTVDTHPEIGERSDNTIFFSTDPKSFFSSTNDASGFKILLIHELGHVIRGNPGPTQQNYDALLQEAINKDKGYLTGYGQNPCTGTLAVDEDFAETVAYYINTGTPEKDLACGRKSEDGANPLYSGLYPNHLSFIKSILK